MSKIKESLFFRGICVFLALSIFNLSCQSSYNASDCTSLQFPIDISDTQKFRYNVGMMLDLSRTMQRIDNYESIADAYSVLLKDDKNSANLAAIITSEYEESIDLGLNGYLDAKVNTDVISSNLGLELKNLLSDMESFTNQDPTIAAYLGFLEDKKNNSALCSSDSQIYNGYIETVIAVISHLYPIGTDLQNSKLESGSRGCNWWQAILCLSLSIVVFPIAFIIGGETVEVLLFGASKVEFNDHELDEDEKSGLSVLAAFIGAIVTSYNVYKWCCPEDEIPEQECFAPTGSVWYSLDCDEHRYVIFGPSNYSTTVWDNINTSPASAVTSIPELRFSVPEPGEISEFVANVACVANENEIYVYDWSSEETLSYDPLPTSLGWAYQPPNNAQTYQNYEVAVTQGSSSNLQLTWSVTPLGGGVTSTGPYSGTLKFFMTGTHTVKATLTDTCTGDALMVSKTVNVN